MEDNGAAYTITGVGTQTLVYTNTEQQRTASGRYGNALFASDATVLNVTMEWINGGKGGQGLLLQLDLIVI